jgi:hypothetical protein
MPWFTVHAVLLNQALCHHPSIGFNQGKLMITRQYRLVVRLSFSLTGQIL